MRKKLVITLVIFMALVGIYNVNTKASENKKTNETKEIEEYIVERKDIQISISADGNYNIPVREFKFKSGGTISSINVSEGEIVKEGQILAKLDSSDLYTELENAKISLEEVKLKTENIEITKMNNDFEIKNLEKDYAEKLSDYEDALELGKLYSEKEVSDMKIELDKLKEEISNKKIEKEKNLAYDIKSNEVSIRKAENDIKNIYSDIADMNLKTMFSGEIYDVNYKKGEDISTSDVVITLAEVNESKIQSKVPEIDIENIEVGQKVELEFEAFLGKTYIGSVSNVKKNPEVDNNGIVNYYVEIELDKKHDEIKNNMTASIEFIIAEKEKVITVPNKSVSIANKKQYVSVITDTGIEERQIVTGLTDGKYAEVIKGLDINEKVIVK
ncbi:MAG: HlyD family efflux transporter periplasmic adaptor subunit [Clostridia bacterium]|jgi:multidrug efflux pump subunit AcrA (membrane-fusion protein)|nr:HlyD family efflux transporter periplasmic adaptor subunit [Clostridia bacterium]